MDNPHYFLYIGLILVAIIGASWFIFRWRHYMRQQTIKNIPGSEVYITPVVEPEPEPTSMIVRPVSPCRWRRASTSHGKRWRSMPC